MVGILQGRPNSVRNGRTTNDNLIKKVNPKTTIKRVAINVCMLLSNQPAGTSSYLCLKKQEFREAKKIRLSSDKKMIRGRARIHTVMKSQIYVPHDKKEGFTHLQDQSHSELRDFRVNGPRVSELYYALRRGRLTADRSSFVIYNPLKIQKPGFELVAPSTPYVTGSTLRSNYGYSRTSSAGVIGNSPKPKITITVNPPPANDPQSPPPGIHPPKCDTPAQSTVGSGHPTQDVPEGEFQTTFQGLRGTDYWSSLVPDRQSIKTHLRLFRLTQLHLPHFLKRETRYSFRVRAALISLGRQYCLFRRKVYLKPRTFLQCLITYAPNFQGKNDPFSIHHGDNSHHGRVKVYLLQVYLLLGLATTE